jgi:lysophospholipase L1-like esterase
MSLQQIQRQVSYLTYAIQNLIDASGNYAQLDEENEFTQPNIFTTLSLTQYIPHYALSNNLRNFMNNQTVEAYGDSITVGVGLANPTTENWFYVLCQNFTNCTGVNNAVGGSIPIDFTNTGATSTKAMIPSHVSGRTTFLDFGTNVIQRLASVPTSQPSSGQLDGAFIGHVNSVESMITFCMLPDSKKFNARSGANVTRTGTGWTLNPAGNTYATGTSTANDTITCTNLNGRYIGVSFLINYTPALFSNFVVEVDGVQW